MVLIEFRPLELRRVSGLRIKTKNAPQLEKKSGVIGIAREYSPVMGVLIKRDPRGNSRGSNFEQPYLGRVVVTRARAKN